MVQIEMSDVIGVLQTCQNYLIGIAVAILAAIVICIAVRKKDKPLRRLIRGESLMAMLLAIVILANGVIWGPMYTLVSLSMGSGQVTEETTAKAEEVAENITEEGIVLLQNNDNFLPMKNTKALNLFGWASSEPIYGGTGSGGISDQYPFTNLENGLKAAGFDVNKELLDFYENYCENRASMSIEAAQNWDLPEPAVDTYSEDLMKNAKDFSDTAVIVLARQAGEGHNDIPQDMSNAQYANNSDKYNDFEKGEHFLQLSQTEENLVDMVCENFENVIVIYNAAYAFELGFVEKYPQIKSVVWAAGPGNAGFTALGKVLNGEVNPSGRTNDTFVYDLDTAPYYNNAEKTNYANMMDMTVDGMNAGVETKYSPSFVNYAEGIYVGYKFYETAASEGFIDYDTTVQYPFGYGLSYTTFEQKMSDLTVKDGQISFDVTVTNTGDTSGKDVVEVYYNPPYTNGGIEKASANLIDFAKTEELAPGKSETVSFSFAAEDMSSYDENDAKAYVLEKGNYEISVKSDSHNVLDQKVYKQDKTLVFDKDNARESDDTAATNIFQDSKGDVTYLSRADKFANYEKATAAPADLNMAQKYIDGYHLNANYDPTAYINAADEMPVTGKKGNLKLTDLRGKSYVG